MVERGHVAGYDLKGISLHRTFLEFRPTRSHAQSGKTRNPRGRCDCYFRPYVALLCFYRQAQPGGVFALFLMAGPS